MRVFSSSLIAAGTVAGVVGAVLAYQSAASVAEQRPATASVARPAPVQVKYLPCEPGSRLRHGTCVRVKHRIVVHEVPAPAVAVVRAAAPQAARVQGAAEPARPATEDTGDDNPAQESEHATEDHADDEVGAETESEGQDD